MSWKTPVIDRDMPDVLEARRLNAVGWDGMTPQERQDYDNGLRGSYTYVDFNRVESNVQTLANLLLAIGIIISVRIRGWAIPDKPDPDSERIYLNNIRTIRNAIQVKQSTPDVPDRIAGLNFEGANNIEKILLDVYTIINACLMVFPNANSRFIRSGYLLSVVKNESITPPVAPNITTANIPTGITGDRYDAQIETDNTSPQMWNLLDGWLPRGMLITPEGVISGYPRTSGYFSFTVIVRNGGGFDTKQYEMSVARHKTYMHSGGMFSNAGNQLFFRGDLQ